MFTHLTVFVLFHDHLYVQNGVTLVHPLIGTADPNFAAAAVHGVSVFETLLTKLTVLRKITLSTN